jgi:CO/xanthine dehydrogenase Mo-binding subunit
MTHLASNAGAQLGGKLREWLLERLPRAVPAASPSMDLVDDQFVDRDSGGGQVARTPASATFEAVVGALVEPGEPVELDTVFEAPALSHGDVEQYSFVACAVEAAVDVETGRTEIRKAALAVDVGTVINPVAHLGQLEGGFAFGVGGATMEEVRVEDGAVTTLNLDDLKIPAMRDVPPVEILQLPTAVGPGAFGAKMAGELTNTPVAPAIANAIAAACGARVRELPLSAERVLRALRSGDEP